MTQPITADRVYRALIPIALGAVYGGYHFADKRKDNPEEPFDTRRFGKTLLAGAIAGMIIALRGDDVSYDAVDALLVILVPIVDDKLNQLLDATAADATTVKQTTTQETHPPPSRHPTRKQTQDMTEEEPLDKHDEYVGDTSPTQSDEN